MLSRCFTFSVPSLFILKKFQNLWHNIPDDMVVFTSITLFFFFFIRYMPISVEKCDYTPIAFTFAHLIYSVTFSSSRLACNVVSLFTYFFLSSASQAVCASQLLLLILISYLNCHFSKIIYICQ